MKTHHIESNNTEHMKRNRLITLAFVVLFALVSLSVDGKSKVKYVFYMIGDGMGINHVYATGIYNQAVGGDVVNFYQFPYFTTISTVAANSRVTDSAAAGTALASGTKTNVGQLGTDPAGKPVVTVADMAKEAGWGVGVITSVGVNHATPGAFYGKVLNRDMYEELAQQLIDSKVDYAAGGSFLSHMPNHSGPAHWAEECRKAGINVIVGEPYKPVDGRVVHLGSLTDYDSLPYAMNRKEGDVQLSDFTKGAVEHLYNNYAKKGFFLMVEGGKIDYSAHDNDAATTFEEVNDFAASIDIALEFYRQHPDETVIIVTADHETGGLCIGNGRYELHEDLMHNQKVSMGEITAAVNRLHAPGQDASWDAVKKILSDGLGLWTAVPVSDREEAVLKDLYDKAFNQPEGEQMVKSLYALNSRIAYEAVKYLTSKAMFGWISGSHSGSPVGCWAIGAQAEQFKDCKDNTDVPKTIERIAGFIK